MVLLYRMLAKGRKTMEHNTNTAGGQVVQPVVLFIAPSSRRSLVSHSGVM